MAPLHGAVVANAFVKVEGNRKSIQHLDGGIVKELRVREGDRVAAGDVLIVLDDSQARAEFDVLSKQYAVLRLTEERLRAELTQGPELEFPADLASRRAEPDVAALWQSQLRQFETRSKSLQGQRKIIEEKIGQLHSQIGGGEAQIRAFTAQLESVRKEKESLVPLVERGLIAKPRLLQLERTASGLEGQIGEITGSIARSKQAIIEHQQQSEQLGTERLAEVARELRDTQSRLVEVVPKLTSAQAALNRMVVRAPYTGQVVALNVFSVGGVIGRGEKLMDLVPERGSLIVEAQVAVDEVPDVHPSMRAEVHLTAYKQRTVPVVGGDVVQVSADRLTDAKSGQPYFLAQVRVDESELANYPHVRLYPGMPATVIIPTVQRTAFTYLVGPLFASFNQAFRQR